MIELHGEEGNKVLGALKDILGLPDEAYQALTIHLRVGDCIRVEAEFIAKGKEGK